MIVEPDKRIEALEAEIARSLTVLTQKRHATQARSGGKEGFSGDTEYAVRNDGRRNPL
jgi:hypothetical protein